MITISSKRDNFRRCGVAHSKAPKDYEDGFFSKDDLAILKADPMLTVTEKPGDPGGITRETIEPSKDGDGKIDELLLRVTTIENRLDAIDGKIEEIDDLFAVIKEQIESINGMIENAGRDETDTGKPAAAKKAAPKTKAEKKEKKG